VSFTIPANVAPASPVTYEWLQDYMESQAQEAAAVGAIAGGFAGPGASGYLGWTAPVFHATSTAALTSTDIYVVSVTVPVAGTTAHIDVDATTAGTVTVADVGLFTLAGVQLAQALTANLTTNSVAWGAGINTWAWVAPAILAAGVDTGRRRLLRDYRDHVVKCDVPRRSPGVPGHQLQPARQPVQQRYLFDWDRPGVDHA